jgi:hypothetical protein
MQSVNDIRIDYLKGNKDWSEFLHSVSHNTSVVYESLWLQNAFKNQKRIKKYGWACEKLQEAHGGKTAILLGASPAIVKQIEHLRSIQDDPDLVFIGISSGIKYLIENGIYPKYVMICDADPAVKRFWKGLDMKETKNMTLIASICVHPDLLDMWEGDIKFIAIWTNIEKLDRKLYKMFSPLNGCGAFFPALSSQYNTGVAFAYLVLECLILIFVGNELSFEDEKISYYVDKRDQKDGFARKPHLDIFGNAVFTTQMFMALKMTLEDFLGKLPGYFFNATEAGIFGVSKRYGNLPWIYQIRLPMAVAQARHIMRTGKPLYETSKLIQ